MKSKQKVLHDFRAFCIVLCVLLSCVRVDRTTSTLVRGWVCPSFQCIVAPDLVQNWRAISWGCTSGRFHGLDEDCNAKMPRSSLPSSITPPSPRATRLQYGSDDAPLSPLDAHGRWGHGLDQRARFHPGGVQSLGRRKSGRAGKIVKRNREGGDFACRPIFTRVSRKTTRM